MMKSKFPSNPVAQQTPSQPLGQLAAPGKIFVKIVQTETQEVFPVHHKSGGRIALKNIPAGGRRIELLQEGEKTAPQVMASKRVGKDLHLSFTEKTVANPDLILEDYYDDHPTNPVSILGLAEDGLYYEYVPTSALVDDYIPFATDGGTAVSALGGSPVHAGWLGYGTGTSNSSTFALGVVAGGVALMGWENSADNRLEVRIGKPTAQLSNGKTVTGTAEPNLTITVADSNNQVIGTGKSDSNGNYTVTLTTTVANGSTLSVSSADSNGNKSETTTTVDSVGPVINIADNIATDTTDKPIIFTFGFSETPIGFTEDDIVVTDGIKGEFKQTSNLIYTLVVSPPADGSGKAVVSVAAGAVTDALGNQNTAVTGSQNYEDTRPPTLSITDSLSASAVATGPYTYTFSFSEAPVGFTIEDVNVTGGSKGSWAKLSPTRYTLMVAPTGNSTTPINLSVGANAFTDMVGNANTTSNTATRPVDTVLPTVTITDSLGVASASTPTKDAFTFTFEFSENVSGFSADKITLDNPAAIKGAFSAVSASKYTLVVTLPPQQSGTIKASVGTGAGLDNAGNPNMVAEGTRLFDTKPPSVSITDNFTGATATGDVIFTFAFTEDVLNFVSTDITVAGGTAGTLNKVSNSLYTMVVKPNSNAAGAMSVSVASGVATDMAGNNNLQGSASQNYNTSVVSFGATSSVTKNVYGTTGMNVPIVQDANAVIGSSGSVDAGVTYSLSGTDANFFDLNTSNGQLTFKETPNFRTNGVYSVNIVATDSSNTSNTATQAVTVNIQNTIELQTSGSGNATVKGSLLGGLRADGRWYYYWDFDGNGQIDGAVPSNQSTGPDGLNRNQLDSIFRYDINGNVNPDAVGTYAGSTSDTYRYATFQAKTGSGSTVNMQVALVSANAGGSTPLPNNKELVDTAVNSPDTTNPAYNDWAALWDAFAAGSNRVGVPPSWRNGEYWTASRGFDANRQENGSHMYISTQDGAFTASSEWNDDPDLIIAPSPHWVALEVVKIL